MKFGVVTFPGSNCDHDMIYVLETLLAQKVEHLWHKDTDLKGCDFIVLPGGFSYGDYLRSGAISRFSPIMDNIIEHANKGGYLMGICNGFQILTEANLVPGGLLHNTNQKFICKNAYLTPDNNSSIITKDLDTNRAYKIPVAHAEGNFFADEELIKEIEDNGQVLFRYSDKDGNVTPEANINGSLHNIAGVSNKNKNVFGMMPHPERAADNELFNTDGRLIFESILNNLR